MFNLLGAKYSLGFLAHYEIQIMRGLWRVVFLFILVLLRPGLAMASVKIDSVLLLDTSASMLTTDLDNRRMAAIRMFISLLGDEDRLAVIPFDTTARLLSTFRPLHPFEKEKLDKLIMEMGRPSGAFTNLHDPVEKALELLMKEKRSDALPLVIMLTDGRMDVGNAHQDKRLIDDLLDTVIPRYRKAHVQLFCLAFGNYDLSILQSLSNQTGGKTWTTNQILELKNLFGKLFLSIKEPQVLQVDSGRFSIDTGTHELTVLNDSRNGGAVGLKSPSGQEYAGEGDDFIRVKNPEAGEWSIKEAQNVSGAYVLPGVKLNVGLPESFIETEPPHRIDAWLDKSEGGAIKDAASLDALRIWLDIHSLEESGQTPVNLDLNDKGINDDMTARDGIFSGRLPHLKAGFYQVKTHADNGTLKLNKSMLLEVKSKSAESPPSVVLPEPAPKPDASQALSIDGSESKEAMKMILVANLIILMVGGGLYFVLRHRRGKSPD